MFHFHVSICTCSTIYITTNTDVILGWGAMSATLPGQVSAEKMRALKAQTVPTEAFKKFEKKRKQALEDIEQNRKETAAQLRRVGEVLRNNADSKDESGKMREGFAAPGHGWAYQGGMWECFAMTGFMSST